MKNEIKKFMEGFGFNKETIKTTLAVVGAVTIAVIVYKKIKKQVKSQNEQSH